MHTAIPNNCCSLSGHSPCSLDGLGYHRRELLCVTICILGQCLDREHHDTDDLSFKPNADSRGFTVVELQEKKAISWCRRHFSPDGRLPSLTAFRFLDFRGLEDVSEQTTLVAQIRLPIFHPSHWTVKDGSVVSVGHPSMKCVRVYTCGLDR